MRLSLAVARMGAWLGVAALLTTTGCAGTIAHVVDRATPAAVHGSLEGLSDRQNEEMLARLLSSPEVDHAARTLVAQLTGGVMDALTDSERMARIQLVAGQFVQTILRAVSEGMTRELSPAIAAITRAAVTGAIHTALSETSQREMSEFAVAMTRNVTQAMSQSLAEGMRHDLGPAIQTTLRENIGPGLSGMMDEQFNRSLGATSRSLSRDVVLGVNDGLSDIEHRHNGASSSLLTRLGGVATAGVSVAAVAAVVLGLAAVALAFWVRKLRANARRAEAASARQAATAMLLTRAVRASEGRPWSAELQQLLRESVRDRSIDEDLRDLLPDDHSLDRSAPRPRPRTSSNGESWPDRTSTHD